MSEYQQVRSLQRQGRELRKRYLGQTHERLRLVRAAIQWANDCTFTNPPPNADDVSKERWAKKWLGHYVGRLGKTS